MGGPCQSISQSRLYSGLNENAGLTTKALTLPAPAIDGSVSHSTLVGRMPEAVYQVVIDYTCTL